MGRCRNAHGSSGTGVGMRSYRAEGMLACILSKRMPFVKYIYFIFLMPVFPLLSPGFCGKGKFSEDCALQSSKPRSFGSTCSGTSFPLPPLPMFFFVIPALLRQAPRLRRSPHRASTPVFAPASGGSTLSSCSPALAQHLALTPPFTVIWTPSWHHIDFALSLSQQQP